MADGVKVGFVGGGKMSQAIASGFLLSGLVKPGNIIASAVTETTLNIWKVLMPEIVLKTKHWCVLYCQYCNLICTQIKA